MVMIMKAYSTAKEEKQTEPPRCNGYSSHTAAENWNSLSSCFETESLQRQNLPNCQIRRVFEKRVNSSLFFNHIRPDT